MLRFTQLAALSGPCFCSSTVGPVGEGLVANRGQCFFNEGAHSFLPSAAVGDLPVFLPSPLLHGLGRESKNHTLRCGEGFLVSGKRELMGLILKDRVRFFPFVLFAFPLSSPL